MAADRHLPFDPIAEAARHWREHEWSDAADGMAVVTSVTRVAQLFLARVDEVLRPFELTFARYEALMLLRFSKAGSLPLGKIGERLQVHPASVTNVIDGLERSEFVLRRRHPTDGRRTLAEITPSGRQIAAKATNALNARVFETIGVSNSDAEELFGLLAEVRRAHGDFG